MNYWCIEHNLYVSNEPLCYILLFCNYNVNLCHNFWCKKQLSLLTFTNFGYWILCLSLSTFTAIRPQGVDTVAAHTQTGDSLAFINICNNMKTPSILLQDSETNNFHSAQNLPPTPSHKHTETIMFLFNVEVISKTYYIKPIITFSIGCKSLLFHNPSCTITSICWITSQQIDKK